jgi:antitoxin (DNA-binding transcriptional repressor) of toxin-antitoxin stability system
MLDLAFGVPELANVLAARTPQRRWIPATRSSHHGDSTPMPDVTEPSVHGAGGPVRLACRRTQSGQQFVRNCGLSLSQESGKPVAGAQSRELYISVVLYSCLMRTVVGVAEARAQLSDIISQAVHRGTVTVIERYGKPAVAVVPLDVLDMLGYQSIDDDVEKPTPSNAPSDRQAQLVEALNRLREAVALQSPDDAEAIYQALNGPYQASRGRALER